MIFRFFVTVIAVCLGSFCAGADGMKVPIIYSTDLYHPHDDPDDHFDLATLFAMPEFDIRAILIDLRKEAADRPGVIPLKQLMRLTGRDISYSTGLTGKLLSPQDKGERQPAAEQGGVQLILETLRQSAEPMTIFTTGSLRDVAAAFNREPQLFAEKVSRLYINIGHSGGDKEWNVELDPHAYVCIMRSSLDVYWLPCFGGDYSSYWKFQQGQVLDSISLALQNYFVYALTKMPPDRLDPLDALARPVSQENKDLFWPQERNMWCTAGFLHAAGRKYKHFTFESIPVYIEDNGRTTIRWDCGGQRIMTIHHSDFNAYQDEMREWLRILFAEFPMKP
ncbi:MAG: nucleoside hydrolase [Candidatus Omnitrophota bacterium]